MSIEVTVEEEEAMEQLYPWNCQSDFGTINRRYRSLGEMCEDMGFNYEQVFDVIKHLGGIWGGFVIFKRQVRLR